LRDLDVDSVCILCMYRSSRLKGIVVVSCSGIFALFRQNP